MEMIPLNSFTWPIYLVAFTCVLVIAHVIDKARK